LTLGHAIATVRAVVSSEIPQRTPLYPIQASIGAKFIAFGGWEMPVTFAGILVEHRAVREHAGIFDISHMGEFIVAGPNAEATLNQLLTNDVRQLNVDQAQYTFLCNENGGIVDDLIVYRIAPTIYLLVVNAGNIEKDFAWFTEHLRLPVVLENESNATAAMALQGPDAPRILPAAAALPRFSIASLDVFGVACRVARTGYTGENGFEILCPAAEAEKVFGGFIQHGVEPCGLGARDTLRKEMSYPMHRQDITADTTPLEAGLGRWVALQKPEFIGREALLAQKQTGATRRLVAFRMTEKSPPPRPHYTIFVDGRRVGEVTSGTQSPSLGLGIGMGYVPTASAKAGTALEIEIRGRTFPAVVETKPLWKNTK